MSSELVDELDEARHTAGSIHARGDEPIICVETYVRFVQQDGKPEDAYKAFVTRTVLETILAP